MANDDKPKEPPPPPPPDRMEVKSGDPSKVEKR